MFPKTIISAAIASLALASCASAATCVNTNVALDSDSAWNSLNITSAGTNAWNVSPTTSGYIAVHFNAAKCMSLASFTSITFGITVPASGTFNLAWTTRQSDCVTASNATKTYVAADKYVSNGVATVPFSDFPNVDFRYVEDLTLIDFLPVVATGWTVSNFTLTCPSTNATTTAASGAAVATGTTAAAASSGAAAAAVAHVGLGALVSALLSAAVM
ncbi:hypothetical protein HKX48_006219 [Thoreauomyces humboldtii]|nr:hypothetical protein HKX48_006219 [Thoreauomyces humboldtii]